MAWFGGRWWAQYQERRLYRREFEERGAEDVRRRIEKALWDGEKLRSAQRWIYHRETRYPRLAVLTSTSSVLVAVVAVWMTYQNGQIARKADRAWLGAVSMRLGEVPQEGKPLLFLIDYQNSGRQPALSVDYTLDSHSLPTEEGPFQNQDRARTSVADCLRMEPGNFLVTFPGRGSLEPYRVDEKILLEAASKHRSIFVEGCFAYRTIGEPHHTAFCFKYDPRQPRYDAVGKPLLDLCTYGHFAD